jgi:hypothetical protein
MRDKERIHRILDKIELIWNAMPDQRFGQLMENLIRGRGLYPYRETANDVPMYFIPFIWNQKDEVTEKNLDRIIKELRI